MAEITPYTDDWQEALIQLWNECGLSRPWHDANKRVREHIQAPIAQVWLLTEGEQLIGAVNVSAQPGKPGCIYYLAVKPSESIKGYGQQLMQHAKQQMQDMGCMEAELIVNDTQIALMEYNKQMEALCG